MMQKSNDVVNQLWKALLGDPEIVVDGWFGIVLVGQVDTSSRRISGYAYDAEGLEEAIAPRKSGTLGLMQLLCEVMEEETGRRWKVCLIKIKRDGKASIDYEFVASDRWQIGPETYAARIEEFRKMLMEVLE
jgi:hypothetical protein